jgi:hypothetical protein
MPAAAIHRAHPAPLPLPSPAAWPFRVRTCSSTPFGGSSQRAKWSGRYFLSRVAPTSAALSCANFGARRCAHPRILTRCQEAAGGAAAVGRLPVVCCTSCLWHLTCALRLFHAARGTANSCNLPGGWTGTSNPTNATMKLRVQCEDGRIETLELRGAWVVQDGELLSRIAHENGDEHFFTPGGYYDGWGGGPVPTQSDVITASATKREPD